MEDPIESTSPEEENIIQLLCQLDYYLIINILLEMDPIKMTTFGAVSIFLQPISQIC